MSVILANYAFDEENNEYFTVSLANMNGSITGIKVLSDELEYNDLIELKLGDGSADDETGGIWRKTNATGQFRINGEKYTFSSKGRYRSNEIYAWAVVRGDDIEIWDSYRDNPGVNIGDLADIEKVVMFGESYRVCENVYVIPYTEEQFNEAADEENGFIKKGDDNNASVYANDRILNETGGEKISMIGSFTLPSGKYELVEAGMLFKATTNGTIPSADLTLKNAGTNGISRMKSTRHTDGNQFVISVNTKGLIGKNTTINAIYRAYLIYTDASRQYIVYSDAVTDSATIE